MPNVRRALSTLLLAVVLMASMLAGAALAPPSTWYVDNTVTCNDSTADSSVTPYCTIQAAIGDASSGDIIDIGPGTYTAAAGAQVAWASGKDLIIQGAGQGITTIDGEDARIALRIEGSAVDVSDLTLHRGHSTGSGGGLYVYNTSGESVTATDVTVTDATSAQSGASVMAYGNGTVDLLRVSVDGGEAQNGGGGGVYAGNSATVTIEDSAISNSDASSATGIGGGIYLSGSGTSVTIIDSVIDHNDAGYRGGGIYQNGGTLTIEDSTISANGVGGMTDEGGGIYLASGELAITGSLISGNAATDVGGGLTSTTSISTTIESSTFSGNTAGTEGGGIYFAKNAVISNSTFTGNSAPT